MAFQNNSGAVVYGAFSANNPMTIFIRAKTSNTTNIQGLMATPKTGENGTRHTIFFRGDYASPNKAASSYRNYGNLGTHERVDGRGVDYETGVWHCVAGIHDQPGASFNGMRLNSVYQAPVNDSIGYLSPNRMVLGSDSFNTTFIYPFAGQYCSAAGWHAQLSNEEFAALIAGFSPSRIRPQRLLWYAPCIRDMIEMRNGNVLTDTGTRTIIDHPRTYGGRG